MFAHAPLGNYEAWKTPIICIFRRERIRLERNTSRDRHPCVTTDMTTRSMAGETNSLLRLVEERIKLKRELEESLKKQDEDKNMKQVDDPVVVPHLAEDSIFNIIIRLPVESILVSRFVCKLWYGIVNSPFFINSHLQCSEVGLLYLDPAAKGLPSSDVGKASSSSNMKTDFSVESKVSESLSTPVHNWHLFNPLLLSRIKFLEIKDGKGTIREYNVTCTGQIKAACNGLIVLEITIKRGGLVVLNPVTREMNIIPLGTSSPDHCESYGLAFCNESSKYKLVHLFHDAFKYYDCEIMDIGSGSWRGVDGPPNGYLGDLLAKPVFAIGALHWVPRQEDNEYIVSMPLSNEKFVRIPLPEIGGTNDRILEMGGFLGFVTRQSLNQVDVWILRSLGGEGWQKKHSIGLDCLRTMLPLFCLKGDGKLVFKCEYNELYVYDHHSQIMRKIEVNKESIPSKGSYLPHVNSFISWKD